MIKKWHKNLAQFESDRISRRRLNFLEENSNWKLGGGGKNQNCLTTYE